MHYNHIQRTILNKVAQKWIFRVYFSPRLIMSLSIDLPCILSTTIVNFTIDKFLPQCGVKYSITRNWTVIYRINVTFSNEICLYYIRRTHSKFTKYNFNTIPCYLLVNTCGGVQSKCTVLGEITIFPPFRTPTFF